MIKNSMQLLEFLVFCLFFLLIATFAVCSEGSMYRDSCSTAPELRIGIGIIIVGVIGFMYVVSNFFKVNNNTTIKYSDKTIAEKGNNKATEMFFDKVGYDKISKKYLQIIIISALIILSNVILKYIFGYSFLGWFEKNESSMAVGTKIVSSIIMILSLASPFILMTVSLLYFNLRDKRQTVQK